MSKTTKKDIIDSALQLLKTEGPEALTQTRVSKLVGVSQGHLTYYFPKKHDLWNVIAKHAFKELTDTLNGHLLSTSSLQELLKNFTENKEQTQLYVSLCLRAQHDEAIAKMLDGYFEDVSKQVDRKYPECGQLVLVILWGTGIWQLAGKGDALDKRHLDSLVKCTGIAQSLKERDPESQATISATSLS